MSILLFAALCSGKNRLPIKLGLGSLPLIGMTMSEVAGGSEGPKASPPLPAHLKVVSLRRTSNASWKLSKAIETSTVGC